MKNFRYLKIFSATLFFSNILYFPASACEEGYIKGVNTGNCIKASDSCGTNCTYTLDEEGNLSISGTGMVPTRGVFYKNKDIKNVTISEGIWAIGEHAFMESSVENVSIPSTVTKIWGAAFASTNLKELVIPDTVETVPGWGVCENCNNLEYLYLPDKKPGNWYSNVSGTTKLNFVLPIDAEAYSYNPTPLSASLGNVYCTGAQIESGFCSSDVNRYEKDGNNYIIYNQDGTIREVINDFHDFSEKAYKGFENRTISVDENGNIIATYPNGSMKKYDAHGNFTSTMIKKDDGSLLTYDTAGNLIGKTGKNFTMEELLMLLKDGNNNTVSITW